MIFGLTGVAQVGKDTAAKALIESGYRRVGFADALREMLYALNPLIPTSGVDVDERGEIIPASAVTRLREVVDVFGWEGAKQSKEVRELLQRLGTEAGREILGENIWIDTALGEFDYFKTNKIVVSDVRFDNEAEAIRRRCGVVVKIERPGFAPINNHASDAGISAELIDHIVTNDGSIDDLHKQIRSILNYEQSKQRGNHRLKRAA